MFRGSGGEFRLAASPLDNEALSHPSMSQPRFLSPPLALPPPFPHHHQRCFAAFAPPQPSLMPTTVWTEEENRTFEAALVEFSGCCTEDKWIRIAMRVPGKTPLDVEEHYRRLEKDLRDIEAGIILPPEYTDGGYRREMLQWQPSSSASASASVAAASYFVGDSASKAKPEVRKKGVPWTSEEHMLFLLGLQKFGKGDWRSISRHFVKSRTPSQVASHAQKYHLRQIQGKKVGRRRNSIHDTAAE